jgi:uncharacterized membrane protein
MSMDVDPIPTAPVGGPDKSSTGMDANTAAGLSALLAVLGLGIVSLVFFVIEKDSQFVKFHSMQAFVLTLLVWVLSFAGGLLSVILVGFLFFPIAFVVWVFMIIQTIKAFGGDWYKVPVIGKFAEQWAGTIKV